MVEGPGLRRAIALGGGIGLVAAAAALAVLRDRDDTGAGGVPGAPEGAGLEVEVLNGTAVDGLARVVTSRLRQVGIDVVFYGTASTPRDSTVLLVRRGDSLAARRVRDALGFGTIRMEPDPRLLLDVSVVLGGDAAPRLRHP